MGIELVTADAKDLYVIWAHEMGQQTAWEHLTERQRGAFEAVVRYVDEIGLRTDREPECPICKNTLVCDQCDDLTCPECGRFEPLLCEGCWVIGQVELDEDPSFTFCLGECR